MMSQNQNSPIARRQNQFLNEEYFDIHPRPYDIDILEINDKIRIFIDMNNYETFLVEIKFLHWTEAKYKTAIFSNKFQDSDIDVYRIGKSLFLRRLLF
jgi:hypothetical protein